MEKDQITSVGILAGGIVGVIIYFWVTFLSPWTEFIAGLTLFVAVAALLAILGWIGWTMATTPPPRPPEEPPPIEKKEEPKA